MQVIAHRGWSEIAPENTHEAFIAAVDAPSDGIECDLRLTADGQVAVVHDADLRRVGGSRVPIIRQTLAQIRQQVPVPSLDEVLDRYATVDLLLELKPLPNRTAALALVAAVRAAVRRAERTRSDLRSRIAILCFHAGVLEAMHDADPRVRMVLNTERIPADPLPWLRRYGWCYGIDADYRVWTSAAVQAAANIGVRTYAYTVDHAADLARMQRWGVNGVITNRPRWARAWLAEHEPKEVTRRVVRRG